MRFLALKGDALLLGRSRVRKNSSLLEAIYFFRAVIIPYAFDVEADWNMQLPYLLRDGGCGAVQCSWRLENNLHPGTVDGQS